MLLDYILHSSVADGLDALDKVRQFAVSKGWTQNEWRTGSDWQLNPDYPDPDSNQYEWRANTGCAYLDIQSSGAGTSDLRFKMAITENDMGTLNLWKYFHIAAHNTTSTYADTTQCHPYNQGSISPALNQTYNQERNGGQDLGVTTIDRMWIFGDDTWICAVLDMNGVFVQAFHFGQFEMFESSPTCGMVYGNHIQWINNQSYNPNKWEHHTDETAQAMVQGSPWWPKNYTTYLTRYVSSFDIVHDDVDSDGVDHIGTSADGYINCNLYPMYGTGPHEYSTYERLYEYTTGLANNATNWANTFPNLIHAINLNVFSNKRVMSKIVYFTRSSVDQTYKAVMKSNVYILPFTGLAIAEVLTYGSQQFMCFPLADIKDEYGIAFRIA